MLSGTACWQPKIWTLSNRPAAMVVDCSFASGSAGPLGVGPPTAERRVASTAGAPDGCSSPPAAPRRLVFVPSEHLVGVGELERLGERHSRGWGLPPPLFVTS